MGAVMTGCAASRPHEAAAPREGAGRVLEVPFFADDTDQCGPSALASVMTFWDRAVAPAELRKEMYLAHLKGTLPVDLLLTAKRRGFAAHFSNGSLETVKAELMKGRPLIAFVNQGYDFMPLGHYMVITGYDDERGGLYVHSGLKADKFVPYEKFLEDWDKTRRATMLVVPAEMDKAPARDGV